MTSQHFDRLLHFLSFRSISTDPARAEDVQDCAAWLAAELRAIGLTAEIHQTPGHPIVIGRNVHKPDRKTVMIYGHYDVQPVDEPERAPDEPADPNRHWLTPPFEPRVEGGIIYGRGTADNKGQIFAHISGIAETLGAFGDLPVNLIVLVEGEEEIGSEHLDGFLTSHREELVCDVIAISDTGMAAPGLPTFTYGLRGIAAMELKVRGPVSDLHSGIFGGAVMNPATAVARLVATLHDAEGRIAIPGFYDDVDDLADWEREAWGRLPIGDDDIRRLTGVTHLAGEPGYTALERIWARPTAEVNGIGGGFQGVGTKTVIPREAMVKLTFRLVPGQLPRRILDATTNHLLRNCPSGVTLEISEGHAGEPYLTDPHSAAGKAAQNALRTAFPGKAVAMIREGGSIPIVNTFRRVLGVETLLLGLAMPDCRAHAPNENFPVENFYAGARLNRALLEELARL